MPEPDNDAAGTYAGIDTHKDFHVVAVIDHLGRLLDTHTAMTTEEGYRQLLQWLSTFQPVIRIGVEGTGSYGAAVTATLGERGFNVVEVNRPNRQMRRFRGKNDTVDAEAAARSVLSETSSAIPKSHDGLVESIRLLRISLTSLRKCRTALTNSLRNVIVGAPPRMREQLEAMTSTGLVAHCARLRVSAGAPTDPVQALKLTLRALATHILAQTAELNGLRAHLTELTRTANPALLATPGVGVDSASALLVTAGDNPERLRSEASFAALCGVSPIEASSGKHVRHRLNRGGDRQANNALWRIAMIRGNSDERTRLYTARRTAEGKSPREISRCLKRHIAREVYSLLTAPPPIAGTDDLRPLRHRTGLAMQAAADHFEVSLTTVSRTERGIKPNHEFAARYRTWLSEHEPVPAV
ncbi:MULTISPECIES: IS110 family transposase [unclassified Rhodococcus (in: high G+C Gram-positive bacteria)]|uniref:IS110 family transposase n=1 Tax=unclassified Rhodococcus (in: high G+C Gram-positive bacteria) TaxID=192944 RepID=UPI0005D37785|nr:MULTISPECIES: IS110 family transposase [unclassified Rhodococcus (in: high G+C Gram-positive bacteria)]KJF24539.1 Transposase IS116/IS110/IS902 family protein [Rhodococcus sp. AD45]